MSARAATGLWQFSSPASSARLDVKLQQFALSMRSGAVHIELLLAFELDKPHRRPQRRFRDSLGVPLVQARQAAQGLVQIDSNHDNRDRSAPFGVRVEAPTFYRSS